MTGSPPRPENPAAPADRPLLKLAFRTLLLTAATVAVMLASEPRLSMVWDEGYTLGREARLRAWSLALEDPSKFAEHWSPPLEELVQQTGAPAPGRAQVGTYKSLLTDPEVLAWFWPFAREEPHGHPPFYALVGLVGDMIAPSWAELPRARLGPILLFGATAGVLFAFVAARWGYWPGWLAWGAWIGQPRLFAHGHYAAYDAILTCLWVLSILAFARAVERGPDEATRGPRWGWVLVFGLILGAAADTKLTGWFLPLPYFAWSILTKSRRGLVALVAGGIVALAVLYLLNPPWWTEPLTGLARFLRSNLTRAKTIPIPVLFFGQVVNTPRESLPWWNTLAWTVLVVPAGFLMFAVAGAARGLLRRRLEPIGLLALGHWLFLLFLRALPHTPGHDGVRQFLPAFGVLALVAGLGAASVIERLGRWGRVLIAAALLEGLASVVLMMPVPLSYYSPLVGGLPGATRLGMEPTYYWDALDRGTLDWLDVNTPPNGKIRFATFPTSWLYLRQTRQIRHGILPTDPGAWSWYVVQNRPGAFSKLDRMLIEAAKPAHVVEKWGVPLVWVFDYADVDATLARLSRP